MYLYFIFMIMELLVVFIIFILSAFICEKYFYKKTKHPSEQIDELNKNLKNINETLKHK